MHARTQELVAAIDAMQAAHDAYKANPNQVVPPVSFYDTLEATLAVFDSGDIPLEARVLFDAAVQVKLQLRAFDETDLTYPPDSFWHAVQSFYKVRKDLTRQKRKRLETMVELQDQKVPIEQIAKMYGLFTEDGDPDVGKVLAELRTPGSVITPDWVHPDERVEVDRLREANQRLHESYVPPRPSADKPCPETPEQLFMQGVGAEQASRMLQWSADQTDRQWAEFQHAKDVREGKIIPPDNNPLSVAAPDDAVPGTVSPDSQGNQIPNGTNQLGSPADMGPEATLDDAPGDTEPDETAGSITAEAVAERFKDFTVDDLRRQCEKFSIGLRKSETRPQLLGKLRAYLTEHEPKED